MVQQQPLRPVGEAALEVVLGLFVKVVVPNHGLEVTRIHVHSLIYLLREIYYPGHSAHPFNASRHAAIPANLRNRRICQLALLALLVA